KAIRSPSEGGRTAWSSRVRRKGLSRAGRMWRSRRRCVSFPPLPWPTRIRSVSRIGRGQLQSKDIVFPHGDVELIPEEVEQDGMGLLNAVDGPGRDDEAEIADVDHGAAVAAGETHGECAAPSRELERPVDVGGGAGGGDAQHDVAGEEECLQPVDVDAGEIAVV